MDGWARRPRRRWAPLVAGAVLTVATAACGNDNSADLREITDAVADPEVTGTVSITGSSTVEPISTLAGEAFRGHNDQVDISVEGPGTGDGMERFCGGQAEITGASRPITESELEACGDAGIEVIELAIGLDGVAVVHAPGLEVECLSFADLYALIGPESDGVDRWSDAAPLAAELGSDTDLPDLNLVLTGPGEESGTYDSFLEQVLEPVAEQRAEAGLLDEEDVAAARADYASSANDNTIIDSVASDPGGLGWVGFSYAAQSEVVERMPISVEPGGECVEPTIDTIRDGTYPISRTLFLYVSADAAEVPVVAAVVDFYLEALPDLLPATDYIALADPGSTEAVWAERRTGSAHAEG